ncbi:Putative transcriptional regulator, ArsR family [Mycobacteroides abscessus subsp. massiliense]|nr:Putative transcriptional regulator, ArsR family [Mycobacteroides abscessus subsp. massiliense]SKU11419.1 Putative transcriptional regulator, ArsR family [Mycobacteroides abscessus subsp. massiliense]
MTRQAISLIPTGMAACCSPLSGGILDNPSAERIAQIFKALSDPARVKLISLIAAADDGQACLCDLTAPVGLSQPTVSHHMKLLVDVGLVHREQRGKWAYYRLDEAAFGQLAQLITPSA